MSSIKCVTISARLVGTRTSSARISQYRGFHRTRSAGGMIGVSRWIPRRGKRGKLKKRVSHSFLRAWKPGKDRRVSTFPQRRRRLSQTQKHQKTTMSTGNISNRKTNQPKVTFSNCLTGGIRSGPSDPSVSGTALGDRRGGMEVIETVDDPALAPLGSRKRHVCATREAFGS